MAVRSLLVKFIADVRQFVSGTKQAEKALTPFEAKLKSIRDIGKTLSMVRGAGIFAGITAAANAATRAITEFNESMLEMERGNKTGWGVAADAVRNVPVTGPLGQALNGLIFGGADRREIVANERTQAYAEQMTKDMEVRIDATRKLKEEEEKLRKAGRERIQEMINLGRQQADDRTRELFETQAINRQKMADMVQMGREQADDRARDAFDRVEMLLSVGREKSAQRLADVKSSVDAIVGRFKDPLVSLQEDIDEVTQAWKRGLIEAADYMHTVSGIRDQMAEIAKSRMPKEKAEHTADFREISLSRTAIGGLSAQNRQQVMDPQLKETNRLLQLIESRFRTNGATYAP